MKRVQRSELIARQNRTRRFLLYLGTWIVAIVLCPSWTTAQTRDWPSEGPPRPLAARDVKFPPYEIRTLANGMQVVVVLHHEQPAVSIRLLVRAGAAQDPKGKGGVATLTAALLDQGTTTKSAQEIADTIDYLGGSMGTGALSDLSFVNVIVMKDSFDVAMDLLNDVVRNPAFAQEEIDRQRQQALSGLQVSAGDPDYIANVVFDRLVYGFHPYGLPNTGTPESLPTITHQDLQQYHDRYFVPNNLILAIVGDVTSDEAFAAADRVFGKWARAEVPPTSFAEPPPATRRLVVVDKPDAVQTEIRVGHLGIPRKHPDYMAMDLAIKILGGEGANRLHRVLRSERGLTYGASADIETLKQAGDFVAETDTRTESTAEALRLIVEEISTLQRDRVSEHELGDAQAYLAGNFPLTIETPDAIATQVLNAVFYDLPLKEIETFRERVQAVTPDDIQRVAKQYLHPDRLSVVLVGNAAGFATQLKGLGFSEYEVIPIDEIDLMSATLRRESKRTAARTPQFKGNAVAYVGPRAQSAQTSPSAQDTGGAKELLTRVVQAKGGLDKLRSIRTVVADADTTFRMEQGPLTSSTKTYVVYPDKFRVDASVAGADVVQAFNAGAAWVKDPSGVHDAPAPMRDDFAASARRDTIPLLIGASAGKLTPRALPEEGRDGVTFRILEISGPGVGPVKLYLDKNNLIARQSYATAGPTGTDVQVEELYGDYRSVDGIQIPFKAEVQRDGHTILERVLKDVKLNTAVDADLFVKPQ
jgi:zinc protease